MSQCSFFLHKLLNNRVPESVCETFSIMLHSHNTRSNNQIIIPQINTTCFGIYSINTPFPNCIIMTSLKILELFLRHSKNITAFSKNKSLKTQILRKKSCFDQIL